MSFQRKLLTATISSVAVLSLSFAGSSFAATNSFADISSTAAKDSIILLQEKGILHGTSSDKFSPEATLTGAQSVQLIVNALDLNLNAISFVKMPEVTDFFTIAKNDAWYAQALIIASVHGFDLPADFDPVHKMTREEFTHQLILAMEHQGQLPKIKIVPIAFGDDTELEVAYQGTVQRSLVLGITKLDADGKFHPKAEISRADAAILINQALEYLAAHPTPSTE
ncbi:S-layer homology domain-containing protein [Paenibacillus anaericanus]|uniref:S-layer homology domain-containing protein n=1 Tax=Paenibacillus anaericanus TaxID=170367 RepID=A0A3S1BPV4_9BACL|nr:S-layer homology domain-containing protein [Paenibacillus anaericanus]RUT46759.1 S-layer homology domain-containing protein [Paenibacillus anaericanus]